MKINSGDLFKSIEIVEAKAEDISDLVPFINTGVHYPPFWTAIELKWWFFEYPSPVVTYRATYKKETIGTFVVFRRQLTNNFKCGVLMGLVVKKEWRGKGLFQLLGKRAMEYFKDTDLFICFPNINGAKALEKNFNFKTIARIDTLILEKNDIHKKQSERYSIHRIDSTTKFNNHQSQDKYLMFKNDEIFRKWRYGLNPLFSYYIVSSQNKNFSIVKIFDNKEGKRFGDIVDFEMESMDKKSFFDLIITTCLALAEFDIGAITIKVIPNNLTYEVAKEIGFKESDNSHYFCVKGETVRPESIYDPLNWIIRWGDFMRR